MTAEPLASTDARLPFVALPGAARRLAVAGVRRGRAGAALLQSAAVQEIIRFGAIGIASTLAYLAIYAMLRSGLPAAVANGIALVVTAVGNTAANRRLTFGVRGRARLVRHQLAGLGAFGVALAITTGSIWLLEATVRQPSRLAEIVVLVIANGVATAARFLVLRGAVHAAR